jgi:hypothetical protein
MRNVAVTTTVPCGPVASALLEASTVISTGLPNWSRLPEPTTLSCVRKLGMPPPRPGGGPPAKTGCPPPTGNGAPPANDGGSAETADALPSVTAKADSSTKALLDPDIAPPRMEATQASPQFSDPTPI